MADTYTQQNDLNSASTTGLGALTLAQAMLLETDYLKKGVLELFIAENPVLQRLPFQEIVGNAMSYDYEVALPGVGFRSVNEGFDVKHGRVGQRSVTLAIFGGDLDVDRFIIKTRSSVNDQRAIQEAMQIKAMSKQFCKYFFDGNRSTSGNEEFDGVNVLLADTYHTNAGAAANPLAKDMAWCPDTNGWYPYLTTAANNHLDGTNNQLQAAVDIALDLVIGSNSGKVIFGNKTFRRYMTAQARINSQITIDRDAWGYQVTQYQGVPILEIEDDAAAAQILAFDETQGSSTTNTASFYVARLEPGYVCGLQNGGMDVRDLGELESLPVWRTRVEWFVALAIMHPRAISRVKGMLATYSAADNV